MYIYAHRTALRTELLTQQLKGRRAHAWAIYICAMHKDIYMYMIYRCYIHACIYGHSRCRAPRPPAEGDEGHRHGLSICAMHEDIYMYMIYRCYIHTCIYGHSRCRAPRPPAEGDEGHRHGLSICAMHDMSRLDSKFGLYKILFHFESFVHKSIVLSFLPSTCVALTVAMLLHDYCKIYDPPSTFLVYATHHTIFAITISCKGQLEVGSRRKLPCMAPSGRRRPHRGSLSLYVCVCVIQLHM